MLFLFFHLIALGRWELKFQNIYLLQAKPYALFEKKFVK